MALNALWRCEVWELTPRVVDCEHHAAYLKATLRDGRPLEEIVQELQRRTKKDVGEAPVSNCRPIRRERKT